MSKIKYETRERVRKSTVMPVAPKATAKAEAKRAKPIVRNDEEFFRLRVGDVIKLNGVEYVVDYVNECRARCIPLTKKSVKYETVSGKKVEFETNHASCNISPNSGGKIIRRLGFDWRANR